MKIDICEYFPYSGESLNDCIERVNRFFGISICPYDTDILMYLINEAKKISGDQEYWEERYNYLQAHKNLLK